MPHDMPDFWEDAAQLIRAAPIAFLATARRDQPYVRAVTPAWVGPRAYIAASQDSPMTRQIAANPRIELLHWTPDFRHLHVAGLAELRPGADVADLEDQFPYPLDDFFAPDRSDMSLIVLTPRRMIFTTLADMAADRPPRIWRAGDKAQPNAANTEGPAT